MSRDATSEQSDTPRDLLALLTRLNGEPTRARSSPSAWAYAKNAGLVQRVAGVWILTGDGRYFLEKCRS